MTKDVTAVVRSQFGVAAADYATSDVHAKGESLARIVELAAPQQNWRVLDVATGAGHMAEPSSSPCRRRCRRRHHR